MYHILITVPFTKKQQEKILKAANDSHVIFKSAGEVQNEELEQADIIMGNLPVDLIQKAPRLKWLQLNSAGCDPYCNPGVLKEETILTNASGAYNIAVSEHMAAATMAMMKKFYPYYENQRQNLWRDEGSVMSPYGACVLVLGLGNIGLRYAAIMKAMGSYVIGIKRHLTGIPEGVDEIYTMNELDECLKRADIVASVLPGTPETTNLFGKAQFNAMKKSAFFINAGRGSLVDQTALMNALENEQIAGAFLDVTEPEPLPQSSPLWSTKNLYITPHTAGGFHIPVTLELIAEICCENLRRYQAEEPLKCVVPHTS